MSRKEEIEVKAWALLQETCADHGLTPVGAEYVKEGGEYYLRCYIDREGGVTIDDCEAVSRQLDPKLDENDFIDEAYTLEVSSPGLGRQLKRPHDFEFAAGKEVEIRTYKAVDGKKEFRGILTGWDSTSVTTQADDGEKTFSRKEISLIRLAFDF